MTSLVDFRTRVANPVPDSLQYLEAGEYVLVERVNGATVWLRLEARSEPGVYTATLDGEPATVHDYQIADHQRRTSIAGNGPSQTAGRGRGTADPWRQW